MDIGTFLLTATTDNFREQFQGATRDVIIDYVKSNDIRLYKLVGLNPYFAKALLNIYSTEEQDGVLQIAIDRNNGDISSIFDYYSIYTKGFLYDKMFLGYPFDPYELLDMGYIPNLTYYNRPDRQKFLSFAYHRVPQDTVKWFFQITTEEHLKERKFWVKYTKERALKDVLDANALGIMFFYPEMLYKNLHPKTDMEVFRSANSLTGFIEDDILVVNKKKYIVNQTAIPVTRYSSCVETGLYHCSISSEETRCGTYYYQELESHIYLLVDNHLVARTKTGACLALLETSTNEEFKEDVESYVSNMPKEQKNYENGLYKEDMMYTPLEAATLLGYKGIGDASTVSQYPIYLGSSPLQGPKEDHSGLYASEDDLDIPMCLEARRQGYDTVLLTHMIGAFKVVSELVDVRSRVESLRNLVWT
jgi:hypothetical protein